MPTTVMHSAVSLMYLEGAKLVISTEMSGHAPPSTAMALPQMETQRTAGLLSVVVAIIVGYALQLLAYYIRLLRLGFLALTAEVLLAAIPMTKRANPRELVAAVVVGEEAHYLAVQIITTTNAVSNPVTMFFRVFVI